MVTKPLKHRLRRRGPLVALITVLLMAGLFVAAVHRDRSQGMEAQVTAIGGSFNVHEFGGVESLQTRLANLINREPTYAYCVISFHNPAANVDDEWLHEHREQLAELRSLELYLRGSAVTDRGLQELRGLNNIISLGLWTTSATDAGMEHVASMIGLQSLNLNHTQVSVAGIEELASLPHLRRLGLADSRVTDGDLSVLQEFPELRSIVIDNSQVTATGISSLRMCRRFRELSLTDADDESVSCLAGWGELASLTLTGADVSDASLPTLAGLRGLRYLDLRETSISDGGVGELQQSLPNCDIPR